MVSNRLSRSKEHGAALVEAAIVIPILFILITWSYDLGRLLQNSAWVTQSAFTSLTSASHLPQSIGAQIEQARFGKMAILSKGTAPGGIKVSYGSPADPYPSIRVTSDSGVLNGGLSHFLPSLSRTAVGPLVHYSDFERIKGITFLTEEYCGCDDGSACGGEGQDYECGDQELVPPPAPGSGRGKDPLEHSQDGSDWEGDYDNYY
ncbi:MAG: pilus assembly protein [Bdellovibrionales bacterium]|nr:pilus assembly protein [Bdellovibrionales bacterium]